MISWIQRQANLGIAQFDMAMMEAHPLRTEYLATAREYIDTIGVQCNYMNATKKINWNLYLLPQSIMMDFGYGGGWLAAYLSKFVSVQKIFALDSSKYFLSELLPTVVNGMDGDLSKIEVIEALFTPLLFEDRVLDLVVASSAVHHADNLEIALKEISRVLKPGGRLILLNETPRGGFRYFISAVMASLRTLSNIARVRYFSNSPALSASCFLYDPKLGDRDYPMWYWKKAIELSGFDIEEIINTRLPTIVGGPGRPLIHFICRKMEGK